MCDPPPVTHTELSLPPIGSPSATGGLCAGRSVVICHLTISIHISFKIQLSFYWMLGLKITIILPVHRSQIRAHAQLDLQIVTTKVSCCLLK